MIVSGEIEPGQRILAKDLKSRFGVSHIPIREAMRALEGEGLLHYHPQRGAVATKISLPELAEIYELRRFLECRAVAAAAGSYDSERLDLLRSALDDLDRCRDEAPFSEAFFVSHHRFHWLLIEPGCSPTVERILRHLWLAGDRYVYFGLEHAPKKSTGKHHHRLYEAARSGDREELVQLVEEHLHITEQSVWERAQHLAPEDARVTLVGEPQNPLRSLRATR